MVVVGEVSSLGRVTRQSTGAGAAAEPERWADEGTPVNRQVIFRHYASIALVCGAVGISAVLVFAANDRMPLIGSVVAAILAFCYFVQQQKLAENCLFKDLFTEFNRRYDALNDRLAQIADSSAQLDTADRQTIVDYFNLCAEEYLFFSEGYIHRAAWRSWWTRRW